MPPQTSGTACTTDARISAERTEAGIALKPRGTPRGCASQWGNARGRAGEDEGRAAPRQRTGEGAVRADLRDAPARITHDKAAAAQGRNAAGRWVGSNGAGGNNIRGCTGRLVPVSGPDCWASRLAPETL